MFFGPKITTVFASRWKALAWSGGVLMTAYCSVPSDDRDAAKNGPAATDATVSAAHAGPVSPWAASPAPTPDH